MIEHPPFDTSECMLCGSQTETTVKIGDQLTEYGMCIACIVSLMGPDSPELEKLHQANLDKFERELNDD